MVMVMIPMLSCMGLRESLNEQEGYCKEDRKGLYDRGFRHAVILLHYNGGAIPFRQSKEK